MEALECIKTRRSVRKFTDQPVTREELEQVVAAAAYVPSWKNTQVARYIVVTDKEKKQRLADDCMMDFAFNQKTASGAPAMVVLTMITGRSGYERDGLGTVIMGVFDEDKVKQVVTIPEGQKVAALIAIGHPAEEPMCPKRKDVETLLTLD